MKKSFKFYVIGWALLLALFNLLSFITPAWPTLEKYTASFWIGWGVAIAAFIGQIVCAWYSFQADTAKKTFYSISLLTVSYTGLIATFIVALVCMIITPLPYWIAAIACALVLVISVIAVVKAKVAVELVTELDRRVETAVSFVYDMREKSESLLAGAKSDDARAICKRVRDALKFSDPMSRAELSAVEGEIETHFTLLSQALAAAKIDVATAEAEELLALIAARNNKCKRLK